MHDIHAKKKKKNKQKSQQIAEKIAFFSLACYSLSLRHTFGVIRVIKVMLMSTMLLVA